MDRVEKKTKNSIDILYELMLHLLQEMWVFVGKDLKWP